MLTDAVHQNIPTGDRRRKLWILILVWALAIIAVLPAICRWTATPKSDGKLIQYFGYVVAAAICGYIYRRESRRLSRSRGILLVFVVFLLTCIVNNIHSVNVDHGVPYLPRYVSNVLWQGLVNDLVIQLSPAALPHSYRFLPNSIVRWFQMGGLAYEPARDLYRLIFGILLFYAIYKYARLYTHYLGAIIAMLFVAVIYPVSFEYYAGQLTDPLSHLSFVLAFIFLETEEFALLLTTLVVGSLAKETVLAMSGYYVLFCWKEKNYLLKAITLCVASVGIYLGVRMLVLQGNLHYGQISGTPPNMVSLNWHDSRWPEGLLLTVGAFVPFLVLGWRDTPRSLKRLALFLFPVLFTSGLFFSFLVEMRNFMPLVFVLAVIAARYLTGLGVESPVALRESGDSPIPSAGRPG
ncbi:MAG TPA: hypothetical protein VII95_19715 [Terriglobales bacterium]|jgi:hypothetical protein